MIAAPVATVHADCTSIEVQVSAPAIFSEGSQPPFGLAAGPWSTNTGIYEAAHGYYWSVEIDGVRVLDGMVTCIPAAPAPPVAAQVASPSPPEIVPAPPARLARLLRWGIQ